MNGFYPSTCEPMVGGIGLRQPSVSSLGRRELRSGRAHGVLITVPGAKLSKGALDAYGQCSQSHFLVLKMKNRTIAMHAMITAEAMKPEVWANPG